MTTPRINDNGTDREMTAEEAAEYKAWSDQQKLFVAAQIEAETQRTNLRAAALAKLGLTADEIAALFG